MMVSPFERLIMFAFAYFLKAASENLSLRPLLSALFVSIILNSAVSFHIEMLSAVFGGAFACIFFNCGAIRLSHARTL
jgi:hypothetical protein